MKHKCRAAMVLGGFFLVAIGIAAAVFMRCTYSEQQILLAGQNYLAQSGRQKEPCELLMKKWYNEKLYCLFQSDGVPFVMGFSKNPMFPQRLSLYCDYYPQDGEPKVGEKGLYELAIKKNNLYTYVLFGKRPADAREIEVDVLDQQGSRVNQYHHKVDQRENYLFYILEKVEEEPVRFQYSLLC